MSVLYDAPGPKSRRNTLIGSVVAGVLILAVLAVVVVRLAEQGQFSAERWGSLVDPTTEEFPLVWTRLFIGLQATLAAAILAVLFSLIVGTLLAVTRLVSAPWYRWLVVGLVELLRGLPVVVTIYFVARALPVLGVDLPVLAYLVIGLTLYNSVIIAEIIRAGVNSLPRGQSEAAAAVGMTRGQSLRLIQLPQAFRVMLPALISQLVVVLKDTALGFIILYPELLRTGQIVVQTTDNPLQMYFVIAVIFILINYGLGRLATFVERRLSRSTAAAAPAGRALAGAGIGGGG